MAFAFANAAIIALYTVVDGRGVRASVVDDNGALRYVMTLFVLDGIAYPILEAAGALTKTRIRNSQHGPLTGPEDPIV